MKSKYNEHITPLLKELQWLEIDKRIFQKIVTLIFKSLNQKVTTVSCKLHQCLCSTKISEKWSVKGLNPSTWFSTQEYWAWCFWSGWTEDVEFFARRHTQ
jgi:hypothetical protein